MSSDLEIQEHEVLALQEVLDKDIFTASFDGPNRVLSGQFTINIWPSADKNLHVRFKRISSLTEDFSELTMTTLVEPNKVPAAENEEDGSIGIMDFKYLPPLTLHFTCPPDYPSTSKPDYTLSSCWLHPELLSILCRSLDDLWEENRGLEILYFWIDFLLENSCKAIGLNESSIYNIYWLDGTSNKGQLQLNKNGDYDRRAILEPLNEPLMNHLRQFNSEKSLEAFLSSTWTCEVCYEDKKGDKFYKFDCQHFFCRPCVSAHFTVQIENGDIERVRCLEADCSARPTHDEIKSMVSTEKFLRYDRLLLSRSLNLMKDVIHCPRTSCQKPGFFDKDDLLAVCICCGYTFCSNCKKLYHGVEPCVAINKDQRKAVYQQYKGARDDEKIQMERKYGKKHLRKLIDNMDSENWLQKNSKDCPRCQAPIDKFEGCNKVRCIECDTCFCWLCGSILDHNNPYHHFSDKKSLCFEKLHVGNTLAENNDILVPPVNED